jgi:aspartate kinase
MTAGLEMGRRSFFCEVAGYMGAVVMKFGGTSVQDAAAIERTAGIVAREVQRGRTPVVVVSAFGGVTDALLALADAARSGRADDVERQSEALLRRHLAEAQTLCPAAADLPVTVTREFDNLHATLDALAAAGQADPALLDAVAASGELLSSRILGDTLAARGLPAVWIDARDIVATDDRFGRATPIQDEIERRAAATIQPLIAEGKIAVLGGFIGRTAEGKTTTLGRGGSDYSASLVGAALNVPEIQIWTDVDGMLTADPRIVPDVDVVDHLSFAEAAELAYFGAKVLHPSTIFPAVSRNIPVRILNSHRPDAQGTLITADAPRGHQRFAALACKKGITVIDITSTRMLMAYGFLRHVFEVFEKYETAVDVVTTSEVSVSVTIDNDRHGADIVAELLEFAEVRVEQDMAIVSVVGEQLTTNSALAAKIIGALSDFPLRMVSQAASRRNVTAVLPQAYLTRAMTHLHQQLFATAETRR